MGKLIVTEYVTLDGVFEEPGRWSFDFWSEEAAKYKFDELFASDALLLGRLTYEGFAKAWPAMKDEAGFGDRMNGLPKYVVSTTLQNPEWNNTHVIRGNVAEEVTRLKQQMAKDILLAGSAQLLETLMQQGLVDEYRLMLHPVVLGAGKRLFKDGIDKKVLRLTDTRAFKSGIVILYYQPAAKAETGKAAKGAGE